MLYIQNYVENQIAFMDKLFAMFR